MGTLIQLQFQNAKPTSRNAKVEKTPDQQRRASNRAALAQLIGLAKIGPPKAPALDMSSLGDVQIDEASITASGKFAAVKKFTQTKGSVTLKYTFQIVGGVHDGEAGYGKTKLTYQGTRVF